MAPSRLFVDDQVGSGILEVIRRASKWVILVSPYLDLERWDHAQQAIVFAANKGVKIRVYVRENQKEKDSFLADTEWLLSLGAQVKLVPNLHAKVYANESMTLVSSMNLTSYSTGNSREIAIEVDGGIYKELMAYIKLLDADSTELRPPKQQAGSRSGKQAEARSPGDACCIRCATEIDLDSERPLCWDCYRVWSQYSDLDYGERYCLGCGEERRGITYGKPLCRPCYSELAS